MGDGAEASAHYRAGLAAHEAGDFETARQQLQRAVEAEPVWAPYNLAITLLALGRDEEAEAALRQALRARPSEARVAFALSMLMLSQGRFAEGWRLYEARRHLAGLTPRVDLGCPEWRGEPLAGQTLIVVGEQGFGDQIMFARFIPLIEAAGARVQYLCSPELAGLYPTTNPSIRAARALEPHAWTYVGALPWRLGGDIDALPPPAPIRASPRPSGRVGIAWQGRPTHGNDARRSLSPQTARRLLDLPGAVSLHPADSGAKTFLETAELIAGLERVITIDSSVAHLAASMGTETRILLPAVGLDWRWMGGRRPTPWYPQAKLFRQSRDGDWDSVLDAALADLG